MAFTDGDPPPPHILSSWLTLCDTVFSKKKSSGDSESKTAPTIAVHCVAGLGRAPVLVAVALIEAGMSPLEAVNFVRSHRYVALLPTRCSPPLLLCCTLTASVCCAVRSPASVCCAVRSPLSLLFCAMHWQPWRHQHSSADLRVAVPAPLQGVLHHPIENQTHLYWTSHLSVLYVWSTLFTDPSLPEQQHPSTFAALLALPAATCLPSLPLLAD